MTKKKRLALSLTAIIILIGAIITLIVMLTPYGLDNPNWEKLSTHISWYSLIVAIIGVFFSLIAIVTPYVLAWVRRPSLDIQEGPTTGEGMPWRFLHITVINRPLRGIFRHQRREVASGCRVTMRFLRANDEVRIFEIPGRWSSNPEPLRQMEIGGKLQLVAESTLVLAGARYNLEASDEGSTVAVAVKHEGDLKAYAFNSYSYYHPRWANPEWELPEGEYLVEVKAWSGQDVSNPTRFRLINRGIAFDQFKLEKNR